jgi:hypothetical protein
MPLILSGSVDISGSMTATTILVSAPGAAGMVSSSAQITELVPLMAYTASIKAASIVSSSTQIQNYNLFAQTSSANTFFGNQGISGSLNVIGNGIIRLNASSTTSVSTSPTVISSGANTYGGLAIVWGDTSGGTVAFSDLIFYTLGTVSILSGHNAIGGPAGRTYSMSGTSLRVAMGAGTYTIRYQALLTI